MEEQGLAQLHIIKHTRCSLCNCRAILTSWEPPIGLDPRIREYRCQCGTICYKRMETIDERTRPEWGELFK